MSPKQEIDAILFYLQRQNRVTITSVSHMAIVNYFKQDGINSLAVDNILKKLVKDQLLEKTEQEQPGAQPLYRITYDGIYFKGYLNKERREATSALFQTSMLTLATLGTLAAGIYALREIIHSEIYRLVSFSIFLSSICTGILLLLRERYFRK